MESLETYTSVLAVIGATLLLVARQESFARKQLACLGRLGLR